ncbi:NosD domain-containing protein [Spirosoma sp.]|uniref:NosD domain-containing protein n=1 Tax=Spirosoma sp. TaxID=1899569 RepID=UPI00260EDC5F|nr:NosD domain-containing protein [Spirosoma sp.]MCX6215356.1 hypothetical protein [Spirosoma sp.]
MQVGAAITNVQLDGIDFICTGMGTNVEGYYGLFTSNLKSINGLTISNCSFQSSQTITNGINIIADAVGVIINNVVVTDCTFENIKRMAIEFQNHLDKVERLFNCTIKNCLFQNLGIGNDATNQMPVQHWGQAISISGRGRNHVVDNNIIDNPYSIAIEVTSGSPNSQITNKTFLNCIRLWTEESLTLSLISLAVVERQGVNSNCTVRFNKCTDSSPQTRVFFDQILNCDISDNTFPVASWVTIQRAQNNLIVRNTIISRGYYGILMDSNSNPAGLIINNLFEDNVISKNNAKPTDYYNTVRFVGGGVYNNLFSGGSLTCANPFGQMNGAARNYLQHTLLNGQETVNDPILNTFFIPNLINGIPDGFRPYKPNQTQPTIATDYAYGAQGKFSYILGCATSLTFNDGAFGDPLPGMAKQFYSRRQKYNPLYIQGAPSGFTKALSSSGSVPPGPNNLAYGTNSKYVYRFNVSDGNVPPFTDNPFGDPAPGTAKAGYYINAANIIS